MGRLLKVINRNFDFLFKGEGLGVFDKIKLKLTPRYKQGKVTLLNNKIVFTDAPSFVSMYEEIFMRKIYAFKSELSSPVIIDCGSNIGLSVIYFKSIFPNSHIIAFEPDEGINKILTENINSFSFKNVEVNKMAVWKSN